MPTSRLNLRPVVSSHATVRCSGHRQNEIAKGSCVLPLADARANRAISRNRKRTEENLVLIYLDSPEPRNTVRFNRLMLQGPDERAYRTGDIGAIPMSGYAT